MVMFCPPYQVLTFSSIAQLNDEWSMITFWTGVFMLEMASASRLSGSELLVASPTLTRSPRMITCEALMRMLAPVIVIPLPGAVCPAIVMFGEDMTTSEDRLMTPPTRKTTMRLPVACRAARKLPGPEFPSAPSNRRPGAQSSIPRDDHLPPPHIRFRISISVTVYFNP